MPLAKIREDYTPLPSTPPAPPVTTELEGFAPVHSPARALQQQLVQRATTVNTVNVQKWSPRRSLALIVSVSAALWMAILMAGAEASKLIA